MKKIMSVVVCIILVVAMTACSTSPAASNKHVEGTLTELFAKIYANSGVESPMVMEVAVDDTNKAGMLGTADVAFIEGLASEAAIMTIPHSMVLLRVDANSDIEKTKQLIRDNADPRKWICVGVENDQVIVDSIGDLIFFVMSANAEAYHTGFKALAD